MKRMLRRRRIVLASRNNFLDRISKPAAKFRQKVRRTFDPNSPTKNTYYDTALKLSQHTWPLPVEAYSDLLISRQAFSPRPSRRFAERHILIVLSTAKKTAFPLRYTMPGTPSTPNSRPRQRCDQDGRCTNTVNTPCQPKHLLAFTVPARLIRGNIGNPTGLATDPEKTSKMLGTENLFSQTLQARVGGSSLLNAD